MQTLDIVEDFKQTKLPDMRLDRRLLSIVKMVKKDPSLSFPSAMDDSGLEGFYRFVGNERITLDSILSGHFKKTVQRLKLLDLPLILHDTSDINASCIDFRIHVSLAVSFADRFPLGVLSIMPNPRGANEKKNIGDENENLRWWRGVEAAESKLKKSALHLMDREACTASILQEFILSKKRFVIRGKGERRVVGIQANVAEALQEKPVLAQREVYIGKRKAYGNKQDQKAHPPRDSRIAKLAVTASTLDLPQVGPINVVSVHEENPPEGEPPIAWLLYTTEPIDSTEAVLRIVDLYRVRWLIEELFKALKTGCRYEARQLESYEAMLVALGIFMPMAIQMLQLRTQARMNADRPASDVLSKLQLDILAALPRTKKYPRRSVREALWAIAGLGGHLKNNGEPGWITLGRGFEKLQNYEVGWLLAAKSQQKM